MTCRRVMLLILLILSMSGCGSIFKKPVTQIKVIDTAKIEQLPAPARPKPIQSRPVKWFFHNGYACTEMNEAKEVGILMIQSIRWMNDANALMDYHEKLNVELKE